MSTNMVRTQVYLPRDVYDRLHRRAEEQGITMARQIREALEDYLAKIQIELEEDEDNGILHADNPIFQMAGIGASGLGDLALNHDEYLYGKKRVEQAGQI